METLGKAFTIAYWEIEGLTACISRLEVVVVEVVVVHSDYTYVIDG